MGTGAVCALLLPAEIMTGTIDLTLLQKHKKEHPSKVLRCLAVLWNSPVAPGGWGGERFALPPAQCGKE